MRCARGRPRRSDHGSRDLRGCSGARSQLALFPLKLRCVLRPGPVA
jgi:hypothetical protein